MIWVFVWVFELFYVVLYFDLEFYGIFFFVMYDVFFGIDEFCMVEVNKFFKIVDMIVIVYVLNYLGGVVLYVIEYV